MRLYAVAIYIYFYFNLKMVFCSSFCVTKNAFLYGVYIMVLYIVKTYLWYGIFGKFFLAIVILLCYVLA